MSRQGPELPGRAARFRAHRGSQTRAPLLQPPVATHRTLAESITYDDETAPQLVTGTWREGDGTVELDGVLDGSPLPWSFPTLGDQALAQFVLEREE
jgi:hypothetical protein